MAGRSLRSAMALLLVSRTVSCSTSTISERPYIFFRCGTGTFPLRKPLSCTRSLISSRRSVKRLPSSPAGTTTCSVRFRPSLLVSVICIVLQPARKADGLSSWRFNRVVRAEGLEPPRPRPLEPKSSASTNSTTPARRPRRQAGLRQSILAFPASRCGCRGRSGEDISGAHRKKQRPLPAAAGRSLVRRSGRASARAENARRRAVASDNWRR